MGSAARVRQLVQMSCGIADAGRRAAGVEKPTPLPVQALDYATGWILAAAVITGLSLRTTHGIGSRWRGSLARTAQLTIEADPDCVDGTGARGIDVPVPFPELEDTSRGPARRLAPPVEVAGAPLRWTRPARALGSDPPAWRAAGALQSTHVHPADQHPGCPQRRMSSTGRVLRTPMPALQAAPFIQAAVNGYWLTRTVSTAQVANFGSDGTTRPRVMGEEDDRARGHGLLYDGRVRLRDTLIAAVVGEGIGKSGRPSYSCMIWTESRCPRRIPHRRAPRLGQRGGADRAALRSTRTRRARPA